ncbi:MAG: TetR/AcrR family transcriptional regulator [Spirochaetaceae bacterium]|jgi:TetR/AcrR family transcriptional regulator|nr:TetR/AcrR family transcriptional regulator [Spirochaetaceae bacterium]
MDEGSSKELISAAALELFAQKGFESVGVNEIAEKAKLAKPSLYHHFGSKNGLLKAIIETEGAPLAALTSRNAVYQHNIVMNLRMLFNESLDFAKEKPEFFRLLLRLFASAADAPGYAEGIVLREKIIAEYRRLFLNAVEDHGNMRGREMLYAETFWALIASCALLEINGGYHFDDAGRFRIVHQYMHGIFS